MFGNKKLMKKILACSVGLSTSISATSLPSSAKDKIVQNTLVSTNDVKSQMEKDIKNNLKDVNMEQIKQELQAEDVSTKNRAVTTLLGALFPSIEKLYRGKYGKFFGVIGMQTILGLTLMSVTGLPMGLASGLAWLAIGGNGIKAGIGKETDGKGKIIRKLVRDM